MSGSKFNISLFLVAVWMFSDALPAKEAEPPPKDETVAASQQQGMDENLEDDIPSDDPDDEQALENPRIVVHEDLDVLPNVHVVAGDETAVADQAGEQPDKGQSEKSRQTIKQFKDELDIEGTDESDYAIIQKTDKLMSWSRAPLTYIQENVPFLTRRNIIFFGRLELDGARYSSGVLEDDSGFSIRRLRLGLAGQVKFWSGWNYKLEVDLTDGENTLSDAYLSYHSEKWGTFRIGNQKVAQTLSGQASSLSIPFMERPLPVLAFTLTRRLGLGWDTHLKKVGANITLFSRDPNTGVGKFGWAARGYFNPTRAKFHVIHIGGSVMQLSADADARLRARPESHVTDIRLVDTGFWENVSTSTAIGLELAGARGPATFRSEFYRAEWILPERENPLFRGWYVEASRFLTGEMAHYRDGKFIRPNIKTDRGAWEVALRYSSIDLNDRFVTGGTEKNLSLGLNWYSKTHWRFMGNLIKVNADGPEGDQDPWIAQLRAQYYF
jgi:phosphate-selective porin OprO/OprP